MKKHIKNFVKVNLKSEKGSITIFTLSVCIFLITVVSISCLSLYNKIYIQEKEIKKIRQEYDSTATIEMLDEEYSELTDEEEISGKLSKIIVNKGTFEDLENTDTVMDIYKVADFARAGSHFIVQAEPAYKSCQEYFDELYINSDGRNDGEANYNCTEMGQDMLKLTLCSGQTIPKVVDGASADSTISISGWDRGIFMVVFRDSKVDDYVRSYINEYDGEEYIETIMGLSEEYQYVCGAYFFYNLPNVTIEAGESDELYLEVGQSLPSKHQSVYWDRS